MTHRRTKLDSVIQHREHLEQQIRDELHGAKNHLALEENQLTRLNKKLEGILRELASQQTNGTCTDQLDLYYRFIKRQCENIQSQRGAIKKLTEHCEEKRGQLVQTSQERKLLEQVNEKRKKLQQQSSDKREQQTLDETAAIRHLRR